jgi:threonine dehydratase
MAVKEKLAQITLQDVEAAAKRIRPLVRETRIDCSRFFNEACELKAFFKCENVQRGGSFKIRGAMNFLMSLTDEDRNCGVVTFSSGNHGQAVAMAAAYLHAPATIVMPYDAPRTKIDSTKAFGPKIVFYDRAHEDREQIAADIADRTGAILVPSYDHPWIIAGQGTAALELLQQKPDLDTIVTPLGGGGLLSGTLVAAKALRPQIKVYGVEPEAANDWEQSMRRGERVQIATPDTIADGLRTTTPGELTYPIVQSMIDGVVTVSEREIKSTFRFLLTRMKILTEPSGVVAAAAVFHEKLPGHLSSVGIILSGGNIDLDLIAAICSENP